MVRSPDGLQDLAATEDLPAVHEEKSQKTELRGRQLERSPAMEGFARAVVEDDRAALLSAGPRDGHPPEQPTHPRDELVGDDRLHQDAVAADVECVEPVFQSGSTGDEQHRRVDPLRAPSSAQLQSVDECQVHVDHHNVGCEAGEHRVGGDAVTDRAELEAGALQCAA